MTPGLKQQDWLFKVISSYIVCLKPGDLRHFSKENKRKEKEKKKFLPFLAHQPGLVAGLTLEPGVRGNRRCGMTLVRLCEHSLCFSLHHTDPLEIRLALELHSVKE